MFNCEDIAMSFMISALTGGQAPLIVDDLLTNPEIELQSAKKISMTQKHGPRRNFCVDTFSLILGLKNGTNPLQSSTNTTADIIHSIDSLSAARHVALAQKFHDLQESKELDAYKDKLRDSMVKLPHEMGLIHGTGPWRKKFGVNATRRL